MPQERHGEPGLGAPSGLLQEKRADPGPAADAASQRTEMGALPSSCKPQMQAQGFLNILWEREACTGRGRPPVPGWRTPSIEAGLHAEERSERLSKLAQSWRKARPKPPLGVSASGLWAPLGVRPPLRCVFSHVALPCSAKVASTCAGPGAVSPSEEEENPARF
ncbi:uncharacterized protein LOC107179265 isoform X3 [Panthera tigris]|uniref:uncharacterized protein LOC107179265 isoform X3 n=1 Tax=Panthera tigris TaxID=9694 RepID=UPI000766384C|nr:uncharacterized protein LOC107179265 isoform X3 [Panthera tigris]